MHQRTPFIFGAQYYRAPTPEPACWEPDLHRMADLGFNAVKFWVQWRWSHRRPTATTSRDFFFDDLDRLMDLAADAGLGVTLNTIFDVAPLWLYDQYPDAKQVMANGQGVDPYTVGHRQIGGHPGPCYNHPGARQARMDFLRATVTHFRGHPAFSMWDVWNEPELCFPQRSPSVERMVCYCPYCREGFITWLREKYDTIAALNDVWGRCYSTWQDVELPRNPATITDFVDWREFHVDTMTREARWRLETVRELDPDHAGYLHVVPNTMAPFNVVTCAADDFALAEDCEVFAATINAGPVMASQVVSAARGKLVYNVESHVNHGCTSLHQPILELPDLLMDFLPQIGLGIRGFLFWQYRSEVLGVEAPGWGLVRLDGSDRPITRAATTFWQTLAPHAETLLACPAPAAQVGIWRSRKNEIFQYAIHRTFKPLIANVEGYQNAFFWQSVPTRFISCEMLAAGDLDGLRLLVMPSPYYLSEDEARQLDHWVRQGGVALVEAHLGGYNADSGRHSRTMPGCGLAERWGLQEIETTAARYLPVDPALAEAADTAGSGGETQALTEDVKKALAAMGTAGRETFPIRLVANGSHLSGPAGPQSPGPTGVHLAPAERDGTAIAGNPPNSVASATDARLWGAVRFAELGGDDLTILGTFSDRTVIATKRVGKGLVVYAGTRLGAGATVSPTAYVTFLRTVLTEAGIAPTLDTVVDAGAKVRVDLLRDTAGAARYLVVVNREPTPQPLTLTWTGTASGLFTGTTWSCTGTTSRTLPARFADIFELTV